MSAPSLFVAGQGMGAISADNLNGMEQTCDTFAQLRSLVGVSGMQVYARGQAVLGDGSGGAFYWSATSTAADDNITVIAPTGAGATGRWLLLPLGSAANITFLQAGTGAVATSVQAELRRTVWAEQFGAVGDGATDDTAAIQAAVTFLGSAGTLMFSAKTYKVTSEIAVSSGSIRFCGSGRSATNIVTASTTANVFNFKGTAFDCAVENLTISASVTQTAGAGVLQTNGTGNIRVNNVRIENVYNGLHQANTSVSGVLSVSNVDISTTQNDCIIVGGNSGIFVSNVGTYGNIAGAGLHIIGAGGGWFSNLVIGASGGNSVIINPSTGSAVYDLYFSNLECDDAALDNIVIDTTPGGAAYNISFIGSRIGFSGFNGMVFNGPNTANIIVNGCQIFKCVQNGIEILGLKDSIISNNQVLGNSGSGTGWQGINIYGGSGLTITENRVGPYYATGNNQAYGIAIQNTFTGVATVARNDLRGNVTSGVFNASTSTSVTISDNVGYNPVGMSIITPGASPYTYTAGASREEIYIRGGTVSNVTLTAPNGTLAIFNGTSGCTLTLNPWESFQVTYSAAPTIIKNVA